MSTSQVLRLNPFPFYLCSPQVEEGGIHFPSKLWWVSQAMCPRPFLFRNNCSTQPIQAVLSLDNPEGERRDSFFVLGLVAALDWLGLSLQCPQAVRLTGTLRWTRLLVCHSVEYFCRDSHYQFLYCIWQVTLPHFKLTSAPKWMDFNLRFIWRLQVMRLMTHTYLGLPFVKTLGLSMLLIIMASKEKSKWTYFITLLHNKTT